MVHGFLDSFSRDLGHVRRRLASVTGPTFELLPSRGEELPFRLRGRQEQTHTDARGESRHRERQRVLLGERASRRLRAAERIAQ